MKISVKRLGQLAIPASAAALLFQLYWLRQTYVTEQQRFHTTVTESLQQAYDATMAKTLGIGMQVQMPDKVTYMMPSIRLADMQENKHETAVKSEARDSLLRKLAAIGDKDSNKQARLTIPNIEYPKLERLMLSMLSSFGVQMVNMDTLRQIYRHQLQLQNIALPFTLYHDSALISVQDNPHLLLIHPAMNEHTNTIGVIFQHEVPFLLRKILPAIIVSLFIALLITGCIWILWRTIIRQQKLEQMKQDFISHVTHELKTPVAILQATNEALLTFGGVQNADMTARYLRLNKQELDKLQGLIEQIMNITRYEQQVADLHIEPLPVAQSLQHIIARFSYQEAVNITLDNQSLQPTIKTDKQAFEIIFSNLLDNAIKYNDKATKEIQVTVKDSKSGMLFTVTDNGDGIAKSHLPFIFDKFYRVTNGDTQNTNGYGLGLSHVKALTNRLGASISVTSIPGAGTTFTLLFPAYVKD
ncbi:sensor histidine kinase [Chitinophaga sp. 30R24]|uniref:sensor histidine kinase n=1 Tax=Chitinophaga sp. 30R24 TaxID=3248838 RepID=UPI003B903187